MTRWEDLSKVEQYACEYSDVFKDAFGFRPRFDTSGWDEARWEKELDEVYVDLDREVKRERDDQQSAFERFLDSINSTMQLITNCTPRRAVEILADAEGIAKDQLDWYGWEVLEYELGLKFDVIKKWLKAQEN